MSCLARCAAALPGGSVRNADTAMCCHATTAEPVPSRVCGLSGAVTLPGPVTVRVCPAAVWHRPPASKGAVRTASHPAISAPGPKLWPTPR